MPVSQYRPEGIQKKPVKRQWISFTANTVEMTLYDLSLRSESLEARVRVLLYPTINRLRGMEQPKERIIFSNSSDDDDKAVICGNRIPVSSKMQP
mmetsp:Transcript_16204/g.28292  ORF Transcript_16204/g.28292 Transcript_16204/m.28292 type:complete len:95 (-) Transcript_16204:76-360(-)